METIRAGPSRPLATCLADGVGGTSTPSKVLSRCIVRRIFPRQRQSYGLIPEARKQPPWGSLKFVRPAWRADARVDFVLRTNLSFVECPHCDETRLLSGLLEPQ